MSFASPCHAVGKASNIETLQCIRNEWLQAGIVNIVIVEVLTENYIEFKLFISLADQLLPQSILIFSYVYLQKILTLFKSYIISLYFNDRWTLSMISSSIRTLNDLSLIQWPYSDINFERIIYGILVLVLLILSRWWYNPFILQIMKNRYLFCQIWRLLDEMRLSSLRFM